MLSSLTTNLQKYYRFDSADVGGNLIVYPPPGFTSTSFTTNTAGGYSTAGQYTATISGQTYVVYSSSERNGAQTATKAFGTGRQTTNFWQVTANDNTIATSITLPNNSVLGGLFKANSSGATTVLANGQLIEGEWVTLQIPSALVMKQYSFYVVSQNDLAQFAIVASTNNSTWYQLDFQTIPNTSDYIHTFSINNTTAYNYYRFVYIYAYGGFPPLFNLSYYMDNGANTGNSLLNWAGGSGVYDASFSVASASVSGILDICNNVLGQSCLKLTAIGPDIVRNGNFSSSLTGWTATGSDIRIVTNGEVLEFAYTLGGYSVVSSTSSLRTTYTNFNSLGVEPLVSRDGQKMLLLTNNANSYGYVIYSSNGGTSWTNKASVQGSTHCHGTAVLSSNGNYALWINSNSASSRVLNTYNIATDTITSVSNTTNPIIPAVVGGNARAFTSITAISSTGQYMYLIGVGYAPNYDVTPLYKSSDYGATWTMILRRDNVTYSADFAGCCCSSDGNTIYVISKFDTTYNKGYIVKSTNGGTSFTTIYNQTVNGAANAIPQYGCNSLMCSDDGNTVVASGLFCWISFNAGSTWTQVPTANLPQATGVYIACTITADGKRIYLADKGYAGNSQGAYYISVGANNALTVTQIITGPNIISFASNGYFFRLPVDDNGNMYFATNTANVLYKMAPTTVTYYSTNANDVLLSNTTAMEQTIQVISSSTYTLEWNMKAIGTSSIVVTITSGANTISTTTYTAIPTTYTLYSLDIATSSYTLITVKFTSQSTSKNQIDYVKLYKQNSATKESQFLTIRNVRPTTTGLSTAFWLKEPKPTVYNWTINTVGSTGYWATMAMSYDGRVIAALQYNNGTGYGTGRIWRSIDYGTTWTQLTPAADSWYSIAVSANGSVMVACAYGDGTTAKITIISKDFGATWTNTTFTSVTSGDCAVSEDGRIMYVANQAGNAYSSIDGGTTWTATTSGNCSKVECSADGKIVICTSYTSGSTSVTLRVSKNFGTTWADVVTWGDGNGVNISISADGYTIIGAPSKNGSVVISYDGGSTNVTYPVLTNAIIANANNSTIKYTAACVSPNGKVMVLGQSTGNGVYISVDAGFTWTNAGASITSYNSIATSYDGSIIGIANNALIGIHIGTTLGSTHAVYDFGNSGDLSLNVTNRGYLENTNIVVTDNKWRHVVETYTYVSSTGAVNPYNMYIDGQCVYSSMVTYPALTTRATGYIGRSFGSPTITDLTGSVDDFRIYDKTLTADQVQSLYLNSAYFYYTFDAASSNGIMVANMGTGFPQYDAYTSHPGMVQSNEYVVGNGSLQLSSDMSQYVTLPSFITGDMGHTISCWVNISTIEVYARICDFGNGSSSDNIILATSNGINENVNYADYNVASINGEMSIPVGRACWTHVTLVRNYGRYLTFYINGVKRYTVNYTGTLRSIARTLNYIGRSNWSTDQYYHGFIEDFRFYKIPLSDDAVMEIYKNPNLLSTSGFSKCGTDLLTLYKAPNVIPPGKVVRVAGSPNTTNEQVGQCFSAVSPTAYNMGLNGFIQATGMCLDKLNNLYIGDDKGNTIRKINMTTGELTTYGTGQAAYCGENINVTTSSFTMNRVYQMICDNYNNLIFIEYEAYRIRKINWSTNLVTTICGTGAYGSTGDGYLATIATTTGCLGIWCDSRNNIYFSEGGVKIRKIDGETGIITTICGTGTAGYSGDGGLATAATIRGCFSITTDTQNNVYIADLDDHRVRKIDAISGIITTVAGTGTAAYTGDGGLATAATLTQPHCVRADNQNNIYILDYGNNCIRFISSKTNKISTICGSVNAPLTGDGYLAKLTKGITYPPTIHLDGNNNVYIMDRNAGVVRKIVNVQNKGKNSVDFYDVNNQTLTNYITPTVAGRAAGTTSGYVSGGQNGTLVSTNTLNNLITNGDFSYPVFTTNSNTNMSSTPSYIQPWTVSGNVIVLNGNGGAFSGSVLSPYSGNQMLAFKGNGTANNVMSILITLSSVPVGTYTLSWYMHARAFLLGGTTMTISVIKVSDSSTVASLSVPGSPISQSVWTKYTLSVPIITSGNYTIKFEGTTSSDTCTCVDYVVLTNNTSNMLINSEFECPSITANTASTTLEITGWTRVTGSSGSLSFCNGNSGALSGSVLTPYTGSQDIAIQMLYGIQQTVTLAVGRYTLLWYMSARNFQTLKGNTILVTVTAVTGSTQVASIRVIGSTISTSTWQVYSLVIPVTTAGDYIIKFLGQNATDSTTMLDNITLTRNTNTNDVSLYMEPIVQGIIPEPTTRFASNTMTTPGGKTFVASASSEDASYPAFNAFNGSTVRFWCAKNSSTGYTQSPYNNGIYQGGGTAGTTYSTTFTVNGGNYASGGLRYWTYTGIGTSISDFKTRIAVIKEINYAISSVAVASTGRVTTINSNWTDVGLTSSSTNCAVVFRGYFCPTSTGSWTLTAYDNTGYIDDAMAIWIGDAAITPTPYNVTLYNCWGNEYMTNGGFETTQITTNTFVSNDTAYLSLPSWGTTFSGGSLNLLNGTGGGFSRTSYAGTQCIGLQGAPVSIYQDLGLEPGTYILTWYMVGRGSSAGPNDVTVSVSYTSGGTVVSTSSYAAASISTTTWTQYTMTVTIPTTSTYRFNFAGTIGADKTTFIDNVSVKTQTSTSISLTAGTYYPIYILWRQGVGALSMGLGITPPGGSITYTGTSYFYSSINDSPTCFAKPKSLTNTMTLSGEWLQVQLPYQMKLYNYSFLTTDYLNTTSPSPLDPTLWAVVGSNDGTNWSLVDFVNNQSLVGSNYTNAYYANAFYPNILRSFRTATTAYYSYYRIIINMLTVGNGINSSVALNQWNLNGIYAYTDALLPVNTNYGKEELIVPVPGQYWGNTNTMIYNNETYIASASSSLADLRAQYAFLNPSANYKYNGTADSAYGYWHSSDAVTAYSTTNGTYQGTISTNYFVNKENSTLATAAGEWLQMQLSFPVRLSRYGILGRIGKSSTWRFRMPRNFVMLGSNDGINWFLIDAQNSRYAPPTDYMYASYSDKVLHYTFNPTTFSGQAVINDTTLTANGVSYVSNSAASASSPYPVYDASCTGESSTNNFKFGNGALSLTAASLQYVQINAPVLTGLDGLTFSVWVQASSAGGTVFDFADVISGGYTNFILLNVNSTDGISYSYTVTVGNPAGNQVSGMVPAQTSGIFTSPSSTAFNHIVWTISPNGTFTIFINGKFNKTTFGNYYPDSIYRNTHSIGKTNWSGATQPYFNGYIDEFRMYNRVVTESEVQDLYNNNELMPTFPYAHSSGYYTYFRLVTSELYPNTSGSYVNSNTVNMSMSLTGYALK